MGRESEYGNDYREHEKMSPDGLTVARASRGRILSEAVDEYLMMMNLLMNSMMNSMMMN